MRNAGRLVLAALLLYPSSAAAKGPLGDVHVEADPSGTAHVTVASLPGDVRHLARASGQSWRQAEVLPGHPLWPAATAFRADGSGVAAWWQDDGVRVADLPYRPESMPALLTAGFVSGLPRVAVTGGGGAVVAWSRGDRLRAAHRTPGGSWSRPVDLGPALPDAFLEHGLHLVTAGESVAAVWINGRTTGAATVLTRRWSRVTGGWEPAFTVSPAPSTITDLDATASPDGTVGVVWVGDRGALVRELAPDGSWGPSRRLSSAPASASDLVLGPGGVGAALWREAASGGVTLRLAPRSTQGWGEPLTIPGSAGEKPCTGAVARRGGETVVVWTATSIPTGCPVSVYDVAPARLLTSTQSDSLMAQWSTPTQLTLDGDRPTLAVDGAGELVAGWMASGRPMVATRSTDGRWGAPFDAGGATLDESLAVRGAPTNAPDGWRVPVGISPGPVAAQVYRVGPGRAWQRTVTVGRDRGTRFLRLGRLGPGAYRVYATVRTGNGVAVLADRAFTAHFQGFRLTTARGRIAFELRVEPRVGVNVRLERVSGRRVAVVRRLNLGGTVRRRTERVTLDAIPAGRYVVRLTAVESGFRRVQLVRQVTVAP